MMGSSKLIRPLAYLVALVMAGAAVLLFWPQKDDETYQVTAYFEKAIGLFPNSDVNILGVPVGKIQEVDPVGRRVKVTMEVSKEYKIPADATAQIVPISVISDRFVEFAPAYTGGPILQDGAVLEVEDTQIPAELDDVFKQLKKLLDAIQPGGPGEPGALGELIVEFDRAFSGQEDNLQGALTEGAELTDTLADTKGDLQGLLANLDTLFGKLATRSGEFGTLNKNLITVLTAISESRNDLEGTLVNLGDLSAEVTDLARDQGGMLEQDLRRIAKVVRTVMDNEGSVRQSLSWLPVLGWGLNNAYHKRDADGKWVGAVDVRDNATAKLECEILDTIPDILDPIKEILEEECKKETGEPDDGGDVASPAPGMEQPPIPDDLELEIGCKDGVKRVRKQLRRVESLGLPADVKEELLDPLRDRMKQLAKECKKLVDKLEEGTGDPGGLLDDVVDDAPDVGDIPNVDDTVGGLSGSASAGGGVPPEREDDGWFKDFFGFLGL